ncbi:hypothetical protein [Aeromicrobium sp.]
MSVERSKLFVIAFVTSIALLAASGYALIDHKMAEPVCQCGGG